MMDQQRLDEIRARWKNTYIHEDIFDLLTEVGRLTAELAAMTAERDEWRKRAEAALADLAACKPCACCKHRYTDDCILEETFDACSSFIVGGKWEWRGPVEGGEET